MKDHYSINDVEFKKLSKRVSTMEMLKAIPEFDLQKTGAPLSKLNLMHYIDQHGDFRKGIGMLSHRLIANAMFDSMGFKDQVEIMEYLEWEDIDSEQGEE